MTSPAACDVKRWVLVAALLVLLPLTLALGQPTEDPLYDTAFDGGWVGTIASGDSRIPFQLNLNIEGPDGLGFLLLGDAPGGTSTSLEVFAAEFTRLKERQVIFRINEGAPLRPGPAPPGLRFAASTLKLSYKAGDDRLVGKISGGIKGKLTATRMSPDRPAERLWQGSFKAGGATTFVQLAPTEDADGIIGGHARFDADTATVTGQRNGNTVEMTFDLDGQQITFAGKLKTKNNKLQGKFESDGISSKARLVPADGNGKPMKFKSVARMAAADVPPGKPSTVRVMGKNLALGALVFTDSPRVRVTAVELQSSKELSVTLVPGASVADGTAVGIRLFNGDGETAYKASALHVTGGEEPDLVNFADQIQPILTVTCATSACHSMRGGKAGLVLEEGVAGGNLVNIASTEQPTLRRVLPGDPEQSYLVHKIEGRPGISGVRMPKARPPLAQEQIDLIRLWITQGAVER